MRARFPYFALWTSLMYLLAATAITGKLCFDQLRVFNQVAATASGPLEFLSPAWVVQQADLAMGRLWGMCAAIGLGIVLIAASTMWVSLAGRVSPGQPGVHGSD
jgi:hypothetical protein